MPTPNADSARPSDLVRAPRPLGAGESDVLVLRAQLDEAHLALGQRQRRVEELAAELTLAQREKHELLEKLAAAQTAVDAVSAMAPEADPALAGRVSELELQLVEVQSLAAERQADVAALQRKLRVARQQTLRVEARGPDPAEADALRVDLSAERARVQVLERKTAELEDTVQALEALFQGKPEPAADPVQLQALAEELEQVRHRAAREAERAARLEQALGEQTSPGAERDRLEAAIGEVQAAAADMAKAHAGRLDSWGTVSDRVGAGVFALMHSLSAPRGSRNPTDFSATLENLHSSLQAGKAVVDGSTEGMARLEAALTGLRLQVTEHG